MLLAEIDMLEKMEDVKDAELWRRKSMKEKLITVERQRRELESLVIHYAEKHGDKDLQHYSELLADLANDKPR